MSELHPPPLVDATFGSARSQLTSDQRQRVLPEVEGAALQRRQRPYGWRPIRDLDRLPSYGR